MDKKVKKQVERVHMLNDMVKELLSTYIQEEDAVDRWKKAPVAKGGNYWLGYPERTVTKTRLKRMLLVLRQESTELERLLK